MTDHERRKISAKKRWGLLCEFLKDTSLLALGIGVIPPLLVGNFASAASSVACLLSAALLGFLAFLYAPYGDL